jgi:hypothetical protein
MPALLLLLLLSQQLIPLPSLLLASPLLLLVDGAFKTDALAPRPPLLPQPAPEAGCFLLRVWFGQPTSRMSPSKWPAHILSQPTCICDTCRRRPQSALQQHARRRALPLPRQPRLHRRPRNHQLRQVGPLVGAVACINWLAQRVRPAALALLAPGGDPRPAPTPRGRPPT